MDKENSAYLAPDSGYIKVDHADLYFQKFGTGDPIVVLHGGPGMDQNYLLPQMLELAKDHQVIFYDQRGSGKSIPAKINSHYININKFSEDLDKLRTELGLKKFILMGHSWGGFLAMDYATKYQDSISHLILLNSLPANPEGRKSFMQEVTRRLEPIADKIKPFNSYDDFKTLNAQEISQLYKNIFSVYVANLEDAKYINLDTNEKSAKSGFRVFQTMSKTSGIYSQLDLFPALKNLTVPTLIIHGNQDVIPPQTAQEIKDAIPNAQVVYLENCGHLPYIEKPEEFFSAIRQFLKK